MAVVGVIGARGGAGASVVAAALARASNRARSPACLVDLAAVSGGIDLLLGIEHDPGLRWDDLRDARGDLDGAGVAARLPRWSGTPVVSADRRGPSGLPSEVVGDVCAALAEAFPFLVLDLPRSAVCDPPPVLRMCDEVLVVAALDMASVAGAVVARAALAGYAAALVVRGPSPGGLGGPEIADAVGLDLAGRFGVDRALARSIEGGLGPVGRVTDRAARALARRYTGVATAARVASGAGVAGGVRAANRPRAHVGGAAGRRR